VTAECDIAAASSTAFVNTIADTTICSDMVSECVHPDPDYFASNGCNGVTNGTYDECCSGGGNNPQNAQDNIVNCTMALQYNATCLLANDFSLDTEIGIVVSYTPCDSYLGAVFFTCSSFRSSDDYSGAGPGTLISAASFNVTFVNIPCTTCTGGTCDPVLGCICPGVRFGDDCQYSPSETSAAFSLASSAPGAVISALVALSAGFFL